MTLTQRQRTILRAAADTVEALWWGDPDVLLLFATWQHHTPDAAHILADLGHHQHSTQLSPARVRGIACGVPALENTL